MSGKVTGYRNIIGLMLNFHVLTAVNLSKNVILSENRTERGRMSLGVVSYGRSVAVPVTTGPSAQKIIVQDFTRAHGGYAFRPIMPRRSPFSSVPASVLPTIEIIKRNFRNCSYRH